MDQNLHKLLKQERFPRSSQYDLNWQIDGAFGGNPLWLAEWLCEDAALQPGMKVLDLGCGRAKSSIFLAKEFGVEVWAADLWIAPDENEERVGKQQLSDRIHCVHTEAMRLPFEFGQFDAVLAFDSIQYFGTDAIFLPYIAQFLKPNGILGFASAGMTREFRHPIPSHLDRFWEPDCWSLRTADWWREHWSRTGIVDVRFAETLEDGWRYWLDWITAIDCADWYLNTLREDAGRNLGYIRVLANRSDSSPDMIYDLSTGKFYES